MEYSHRIGCGWLANAMNLRLGEVFQGWFWGNLMVSVIGADDTVGGFHFHDQQIDVFQGQEPGLRRIGKGDGEKVGTNVGDDHGGPRGNLPHYPAFDAMLSNR